MKLTSSIKSVIITDTGQARSSLDPALGVLAATATSLAYRLDDAASEVYLSKPPTYSELANLLAKMVKKAKEKWCKDKPKSDARLAKLLFKTIDYIGTAFELRSILYTRVNQSESMGLECIELHCIKGPYKGWTILATAGRDDIETLGLAAWELAGRMLEKVKIKLSPLNITIARKKLIEKRVKCLPNDKPILFAAHSTGAVETGHAARCALGVKKLKHLVFFNPLDHHNRGQERIPFDKTRCNTSCEMDVTVVTSHQPKRGWKRMNFFEFEQVVNGLIGGKNYKGATRISFQDPSNHTHDGHKLGESALALLHLNGAEQTIKSLFE